MNILIGLIMRVLKGENLPSLFYWKLNPENKEERLRIKTDIIKIILNKRVVFPKSNINVPKKPIGKTPIKDNVNKSNIFPIGIFLKLE